MDPRGSLTEEFQLALSALGRGTGFSTVDLVETTIRNADRCDDLEELASFLSDVSRVAFMAGLDEESILLSSLQAIEGATRARLLIGIANSIRRLDARFAQLELRFARSPGADVDALASLGLSLREPDDGKAA